MKNIFASIVITIFVSVLFGFVGLLSGGSFIAWAGVSFILQYIIFYLYNMTLETFAKIKYNKNVTELMKASKRNVVNLKCAVCGEINEVDIDLNKDNSFRCKKCNSLNKVFVEMDTVQLTEILDTSKIITSDMIDKIREEDKNDRG